MLISKCYINKVELSYEKLLVLITFSNLQSLRINKFIFRRLGKKISKLSAT